MASDIFDPFSKVQLGPLIAKYEGWILFTILLFFFWAIIGISLRRHFERSRSLRVLITTLAVMFAVATYFSIYKGWLHLSLQGLGMFGVSLLFISIFFIIYGMIRGYGMQASKALSIGYVLFYISLRAISPNILNTLADIFPIGNLILLILFIVSLVKIIASFFHHSKVKFKGQPISELAQMANNVEPDPIGIEDIDKELEDDKREIKTLKRETFNVTKKEIKSVGELDNDLKDLIKILSKQDQTITPALIERLHKTIIELGPKLQSLMKGLRIINEQLNFWEVHHKKDISDLNRRLRGTKNKKQAAAIKKQLTYQKRMVQAQTFMEENELKIKNFYDQFVVYLKSAMPMISNHVFDRAVKYIKKARYDLREIKHIFKILKQIEAYILKLDKKLIRDLKYEKAA